jgi:hypothetical protein
MGKVISTINVKDFGEEKLPGIDLTTHHYLMTMRTQSSGCAGDSDNTTKIEMWVAPIKAGLDCPERYAPMRTTPAPAGGQSGCQTTYEQHGDLDALKDMYMGMPVREKIYQGDRVAMELDMREYSTAALDPALFDIPSDYRELSRNDFDKTEQQAMMNSMKGMGNSGSQGPSDNSSNSSDQQSQSNEGTTDQSGTQNNSSHKHHGFHLPNLPF